MKLKLFILIILSTLFVTGCGDFTNPLSSEAEYESGVANTGSGVANTGSGVANTGSGVANTGSGVANTG